MKKKRIALIGLTAFVAIGIDAALVGAQSDRQDRHRVPAEFMSYLGAEWLEREDRVVQEQPELVLRPWIWSLAPSWPMWDVVRAITLGKLHR